MENTEEIKLKLHLAKVGLETIIEESAELSPARTIAEVTLKKINN